MLGLELLLPEITGNDVAPTWKRVTLHFQLVHLSVRPWNHNIHLTTHRMSKTVAIYGATAFSAGPTIEYLVQHPEAAQYSLILSGRNREKLEKVKSNLAPDADVVVLQLDDAAGVKSLAERADVIINVAGMFSLVLTIMWDAG